MAKCEKCGVDGPELDVYKYPAYDESEEKVAILCPDCASVAGFCPVCGWFVAGSGDENWNGTGICYECCQILEAAFYDDDLGY